MAFLRHQRVSSLIQQELSELLLRELEFDGALVTITQVEVQKDLDTATIGVSVIPSEAGEKIIALLQKNRARLERLLLRKINIKPMPTIVFQLDHGPEEAAKIEKAFLKIEKETPGL